jgi:hypothetical protein
VNTTLATDLLLDVSSNSPWLPLKGAVETLATSLHKAQESLVNEAASQATPPRLAVEQRVLWTFDFSHMQQC